MDHCIITEPDLVSVGDYSSLESGTTLQAHLFQDRVRTMAKVNVGDRCNVGHNSVVLLGGNVGENVTLGSMSLLMQHENITTGEWHGSPVQLVANKHAASLPSKSSGGNAAFGKKEALIH